MHACEKMEKLGKMEKYKAAAAKSKESSETEKKQVKNDDEEGKKKKTQKKFLLSILVDDAIVMSVVFRLPLASFTCAYCFSSAERVSVCGCLCFFGDC